MKKNDNVIMNEAVLDFCDEVRCVAPEGELGIISSEEALDRAYDMGLDLVLVAPQAKPPVAKIMDYGKYKYQQEKKKKEAKKKQAKIDIKEIKFTSKINQHDIDYKVKHALEFLEKGKYVKFRVFLRGREISTPEAGFDVLNRVWEMVKDYADRDSEPRLEGNYINMLVTPKKKNKK
ncbi:MAG: translation initiation factor IF-3 [Epsilonproteobacteria bacterium]|nr:translation initiation factor IF-3 [Campylobacterota bacterium]